MSLFSWIPVSGTRVAALLLIVAAVPGLAAAPPVAPVAVAPGDIEEPRPAGACSSFHWAASLDAVRYELVVYQIDEESGHDTSSDGEPALSTLVPGAASSWTPPLDRCLRTGATYAWSLRAILAHGPSAWAAPLFFRVPVGPSPAEIERALEVLRRLEPAPRTLAEDSLLQPGDSTDPTAIQRIVERTPGVIGIPPPVYHGSGRASLRVAGEMRAVDSSGEPRLWGKGRPGARVYGRDDLSGAFCTAGAIRFGLSLSLTSWSSAADACPEGSWVCRRSEIESVAACDTARPDGSLDTYRCEGEGIDWSPSSTPGWLADQPVEEGLVRGAAFQESGTQLDPQPCETLPVWCCFD